jgi:hypothetical protein
MPYTPTNWINGSQPFINAANLNKIEGGVEAAMAMAEQAYDLAELAGSGGGGGGTFGQPQIVVASADAPASVRSSADFVCDGTADQVQINQALALAAPLTSRGALASPAGAAQRGRVLLTGGRFNCSGAILMHTATHLMGMGMGGTEVRAVSITGGGLIMLAHKGVHLAEVSHMMLEGNYSSGGTCSGIYFDMTDSQNSDVSGYPSTSPDSYHLIHDLFVNGFDNNTLNRHGIWLGSASTANNRGNIVDRCQVRNISGNGIHFQAASDSFIANCHVGTIGGSGYRIATGNMKVANCKSFYCDQYGFYATSGRGTLSGFESQDDNTGIFLDAEPWTCAALTADTSRVAGIRVGSPGVVIAGFHVFKRGGGRTNWPGGSSTAQDIGLHLDASHADLNLTGVVDGPSGITSAVTGTAGARSFVRVSTGTSLVAAG